MKYSRGAGAYGYRMHDMSLSTFIAAKQKEFDGLYNNDGFVLDFAAEPVEAEELKEFLATSLTELAQKMREEEKEV